MNVANIYILLCEMLNEFLCFEQVLHLFLHTFCLFPGCCSEVFVICGVNDFTGRIDHNPQLLLMPYSTTSCRLPP